MTKPHPHEASRRSDARSSVSVLGPVSARVRLEGFFRPAWMAGLCGGLAERRVSIDRAHATRAGDGSWLAELDISPPYGIDAARIPYVELADSERTDDSGELRLKSFQLDESPDHGGTLKLAFAAKDSLGLLGRMLGLLAMLGLFPVAMRIETHQGHARDVLWLSGLGRSLPSAQARQSLERVLSSGLHPLSRTAP
jgi:hypothetical protein